MIRREHAQAVSLFNQLVRLHADKIPGIQILEDIGERAISQKGRNANQTLWPTDLNLRFRLAAPTNIENTVLDAWSRRGAKNEPAAVHLLPPTLCQIRDLPSECSGRAAPSEVAPIIRLEPRTTRSASTGTRNKLSNPEHITNRLKSTRSVTAAGLQDVNLRSIAAIRPPAI